MPEWLRLCAAAASSFGLTLLLVPPVRAVAARWGCVSAPSEARWHRRPTPYLGGAAFFPGFVIPALVLAPSPWDALPLLLVASQMFVLGLYDDLRRINPATKLVGQFIAAATAIFFGYTLRFFGWPMLDTFLTALWIVALTNSVNLLDNMDGLAAGIGLIAALYLAVLFQINGDLQHAVAALALAGALAAFLRFNFHPASVFMGDAGSLFLGSALSLLTLRPPGQASDVLSVVGVPTLILLVPILDTALVSLTRPLRGQPISQGGKDHSSHRLVVLGLEEPRAVVLLYVMAVVAGATAVLIERLSYTLGLALLPLVVLSFALFTAYLAQVKIVPEGEEVVASAAGRSLPNALMNFTYKRRLLEVVLDFFLVSLSYYLAFALRYELHLNSENLGRYVDSLPLVVASTYGAFFLFGMYRGVWRHAGLEDLLRIGKGVIGGALLSIAAVLLFYRFSGYSRAVFILYPLFLFLAVAGSRLSFRVFGLLIARPQRNGVSVLIYGAGDGGELAVRECRKNPRLGFRPVAFLDDDPNKKGHAICGLPVAGGLESLEEILDRENIAGVIIASRTVLANGKAERVRRLASARAVWVRRLRLDFVEE